MWNNLPQEYPLTPGLLHFRQSGWHIDARFEQNGHAAWQVHSPTGWHATVAWEDGPFTVGRTMVPEPHDILQPACVVRITGWHEPTNAKTE
jgi:hypothetical protein